MTKTWAYSIQQSLLSMGFTINKRETDNHWQILLGEEIVLHGRALGCILRKAANEFGIELNREW